MKALQLAFRNLMRRPGTTLGAASALAPGIGLLVTQFSFVNGVMIKGLPFENSQQLPPWLSTPAIYAAVAALVLGVAAAAVWIPARRATRIQPAEALRQD